MGYFIWVILTTLAVFISFALGYNVGCKYNNNVYDNIDFNEKLNKNIDNATLENHNNTEENNE